MKTIKVFIAFSDELEIEHKKFTDMIQQLNSILKSRNFEIEPVYWKSPDDSIGSQHKQEEYDKELKTYDMFLFFYWTRFGDFTKGIFDTVYSEYCTGHNPKKLYVYFKETEDITPELRAFKENFVSKYRQFYSRFENVDMMILHFLLQLSECQEDIFEFITAYKSCIVVEGQPFLEIKNMPFAGKNQEYFQLIEKIEKIKNKIEKNQESDILYKKLKDLQKRLNLMEINMLETARFLTKLSSSVSSIRLAKAMLLFEVGDYNEANTVLNLNEITHDARKNADRIDAAPDIDSELIKALESNIDEFKLKIRILHISMEKGWQEEVKSAYKKAISVARNRIPSQKTAQLLVEYAEFQQDNHYDSMIEDLYEESLSIYQNLAEQNLVVYDKDLSRIHDGLTRYNYDNHNFNLAEKECMESLNIYRRLSAKYPEIYEASVAFTLIILANVHIAVERLDLAEKEYIESLSIYRRLSAKYTGVYENSLTKVLDHLIDLHLHTEQYDLLEDEYRELLEVCRNRLVRIPNDEETEVAIAYTLVRFSELHYKKKQFDLAEKELEESLKIYTRWALKNPVEYEGCVDYVNDGLYTVRSEHDFYNCKE